MSQCQQVCFSGSEVVACYVWNVHICGGPEEDSLQPFQRRQQRLTVQATKTNKKKETGMTAAEAKTHAEPE